MGSGRRPGRVSTGHPPDRAGATLATGLPPARDAPSPRATRAGVTGRLADQTRAGFATLSRSIHDWHLVPAGTEGWRTAEVTAGGVDTRDLDARSFSARAVPGLHVVGELVDVTGWLGGYNFQWAWSSGWAAGQVI